MYCAQCGEVLKEQDKFCVQCGEKLTDNKEKVEQGIKNSIDIAY